MEKPWKTIETALETLGNRWKSTPRYGPALKHIAEIIERGVRDHPELSVGALSEGELKARSVGAFTSIKPMEMP